MITVIYLPNPFKPSSRVIKPFTPDEAKTLADLQKHFGVNNPAEFVWAVNGKYTDAAKISDTRLQALDFVVIAPRIMGGGGGGGGKNVIALVAGIALMAFTGGAGAGLMGILGTTTGSLGLGLALYGGGSLLMGNQKMPKVDMPTVSGAFEGGQNWSPDQIRVQPGNPIPVTYGSVRTSGQLISRRIRSGYYNSKQTQFLDLLLSAGEGPLDSITDIKVNDIQIASVGGASYEIKLGTNNQTENILSRVVEYQGFSSALPISETEWVTKAQSEAGEKLTLDFVFSSGLYAVAETGANAVGEGAIRWQYKESGASTWIDGATVEFAQNVRRPFYFTVKFTPPDTAKTYEFRAQNYTLKHYQDKYGGVWLGYTEMPGNYSVAMTWVGLTVTGKSTQTFPGIALVVISLPATENLSGSMPKVSWTQTRANIYAWNPTAAAYELKPATNIAWMIYDLIHQCKYLYNTQTSASEYVVFGEAKEKLDYAAFDAWATFCGEVVSDVGRCIGNMLLDSADQLWPIIQKVASSGRGFIIQQAGVFKPVWDAERTVSQIFTAGNIINGSIKGGFLSESERATAIEASFINQDNGYERDTLFVSNSGYNPAGLVNPTQVFFYGLTDSRVVFRAARHLLRKNQYLKRTLSFQADIDSIVSEIGDTIGVQSDITDWGVGGRVLGATATSVVIDQAVTLAPDTTYSLLVRFPDGTLVRKTVDAVLVSTTTSTLAFAGDPWTTAPVRFSVYSFGVNNLETKPFQITSINRNGDLQATIECLEYVAGVYSDDTDFPVVDYTAANAAVNTLTVNADADTGKLYVSWSLPEDKDYTGSIVYIDGKPQGFFTTEQTGGDFSTTPGTHTVAVVPIGAGGRGGSAAEQEITLGSPTLSPVSAISLSSTVRGQSDGTNLVYITGTFTIPDLASSVLIEIGEGSNPVAWATVQDSRVPAVLYGPVPPGTLYTLRLTAKNRYASATPALDTITTAGDTTAPGAPSIGVTSYLKTVTIQISLATVPSDMAGFAIYRHTANNSAAASQIGSITSKDGRATYTDEAPAYAQTYYYWVKSFDTWGNPSAFSASEGHSTLITAISGTDIVDGALSRSALFQEGVVDAAAIGSAAVTEAKIATAAVNTAQLNNAALKAPLGAVLSLSAKNCTAASIAEVNGVRDVSGNSNHGQAFNGVAIVDSDVGKAFSFDGINDSIALPDSLTGESTEMTISLWIKLDAASTVGAEDALFDVSSPRLEIYRNHTSNKIAICHEFGSFVSDATLDYGELAYLTFVFNGSTVKIYKNSTMTSEHPCVITKIGISPTIGARYSKTLYFIDGIVSGFKLFTRALSLAEVKTLYMFPEDAAFGNITADLLSTGELITQTAQIKDAIISSAKISALDAAKITTGTLAADRIAAGSITGVKIAGSTITSEKMLIGKAGAALNEDPNFEDASAWVQVFGSGTISKQTVSDGVVGGTVGRGSVSSNPAYRTSRLSPVDPSKKYRLTALVRLVYPANPTTTSTFYIIYADYLANGSRIYPSSHQYPAIATLSHNSGWARISYIYTPAANAAYIAPGVLLNNTAVAGYGEFQDFRLEEVLPSTLIQDGAVITEKLAANAVTAVKIEAGAVETEKLAAEAVTAAKVDATIVKTTELQVYGKNRCIDPAFDGVPYSATFTNPGFSSVGSRLGKWEVVAQTGSVNSYGYHKLSTSIGSVASDKGANAMGWAFLLTDKTATIACKSDAFAVNPSTPYHLSIGTYNGTGKVPTGTLKAEWYTSSGSLISTSTIATFNPTATPTRRGGSVTSPATAAICRVRIELAADATNGGGALIFSAAQVEEGAVMTSWVNREQGTVTADRIVAGQIKSLNYSTTAGSMIDLDAGDAKFGGSSAPRFSFSSTTNTGTIAGFTFNGTDMTAGTGDNAIGISTDPAKKALWAGSATPADGKFFVDHDGFVHAEYGEIGGFGIGETALSVSRVSGGGYGGSVELDSLNGRIGSRWSWYTNTTNNGESYTAITMEGFISYSRNKVSGLESIVTVKVRSSDGSTTAQAPFHSILANTAYTAFYTNGCVYIGNNCSALSFTDRTEMPESMEEALEIINTMQPTRGKVDYKRLSNKAKKFIVQKAEDGSEYIEEGRDLTKTVSALVMVCQKLQEEVIRLSDRLACLEAPALDEEREYIEAVDKVIEENRGNIRARMEAKK